jgi:hypothetical protein
MQGGLGLELAQQHRPDLILLDRICPVWAATKSWPGCEQTRGPLRFPW